MSEIHFIVALELVNIFIDTKITGIGAFIAKLQANQIFMAAILNFEILAGNRKATGWSPLFLKSAYSKTLRCKINFHASIGKCTIYLKNVTYLPYSLF